MGRTGGRWLWMVPAVAAVAGLLWLLLRPGALWLVGPGTLRALAGDGHAKNRADVLTNARQILLASAGGTAALVGLVFSGRTFYLSRRSYILDRYAKAGAQLASPSAAERKDGLYALEQTLTEFPALHATITLRLAAYLTERPGPRSELSFCLGDRTSRVSPVNARNTPGTVATSWTGSDPEAVIRNCRIVTLSMIGIPAVASLAQPSLC
jgi:hypothetical protein